MASPATEKPKTSYALKRNYAATTRLNCQFFLWKWELGYSLHPSILRPTSTAPTTSDDPPRIADLATGTLIWPLDVSRTYPHAHIDGFDISLEQCPPAAWFPPNITVREWDIFSPLPPELDGVYDVVHIRLLLLVVRNNDPRPLLRNALTMLKPGGWIQWDEIDPWNAYTEVAGEREEEGKEGFQRKQELTAMETLQWVKNLHGVVEEVGFEEVRREEVGCELSLAKYYQDMQFLVMEEEAAHKEGEHRERVERAIWEGVQEGGRGRARVTPKIVVLGRKPLEGG